MIKAILVIVLFLAWPIRSSPLNPVNPNVQYNESQLVDTQALGAPFKGKMYTGYITVNNQTSAKVYYTLYSYNGVNDPASTLNLTAPLFIWVQGGPGCSVQQGDHNQIGPFEILWNGTQPMITVKNYTWNTKAHLLFAEDVLGVGFSVGIDTVNSSLQVAEYLHVFLVRFFQIYTSLANQDMYLIGESYGGHFSTALGAQILANNTANQFKFKGLVITDGLVDVHHQMQWWAQYAYAAGLVDPKTRSYYQNLQLQMSQAALDGNPTLAREINLQIINGLSAAGGGFQTMNYRLYPGEGPTDAVDSWLLNETVKELLHVDPTSNYNGCVDIALQNLIPDRFVSFGGNLTYILNHADVKVLIWEGQDDFLINTPGVMSYIKSLSDWDGYQAYFSSKKVKWTSLNDKTTVFGTFKRSRNFTFANLYKAGHLVPQTQPASAFDLISRLLTDDWS